MDNNSNLQTIKEYQGCCLSYNFMNEQDNQILQEQQQEQQQLGTQLNNNNNYLSPFNSTVLLETSFKIWPIAHENENQPFIIEQFTSTMGQIDHQGGEGQIKFIRIKDKLYTVKRVKKVNLNETIQVKSLQDSQYIRKLYYSFQCDEYHYLVMEYIDGFCITNFIEENNLDKEDYQEFIKKLFFQIVQGICFLHQNGIVHGDIKPDNILYDGQSIKLIDFGHCFNESEQLLLDFEIGTKVYRALELWNNNNSGFKIDIYSLGVSLYECLLGKLPFLDFNILDKVDDNQINQEIKNQIENGILHFPDTLPENAKSLLTKLLNKIPNQRPTIFEVIKDPYFSTLLLFNHNN